MMGVSVGGIDLANGIINAELRIGVLEKIVERLVQYAPQGAISQDELDGMRESAFESLKQKYPNSGLERSKT